MSRTQELVHGSKESLTGSSPARQALEVWIDFVCPYCLLAEGPIEEAVRGLNVEVRWQPLELRPAPTPTLRPEGEYLQTVWRRSVYPLAARLGVEIRLPSISPQPYSSLAFEGLHFARQHGKAEAYTKAVLRAFFQKDLDIGNAGVLQRIAEDVGLPPGEFSEALSSHRFADAHLAALDRARALGIRAVPTLIFGDKRMEGMPEPAMLRRLLESSLGA